MGFGCHGAPAVLEQGLGDVAEDDGATGAYPLQARERNQAVARPHIEQRVAFSKGGALEHAIPDPAQALHESALTSTGISAATGQQPRRPRVLVHPHRVILAPRGL